MADPVFIKVGRDVDARFLRESLKLPAANGLVVLNGGTASDMDADVQKLLRSVLTDGLAQTVVKLSLNVITGGTDAGVFKLFGEGIDKWGLPPAVVGVAPEQLVAWPGAKLLPATALERHHTHFVLVEGEKWGDETATMYRLVEDLANFTRSVAVFAGGGDVTLMEMESNVRQQRRMVILAGSGRAADMVLRARVDGAAADERCQKIAAAGDIVPFDLRDGPCAFAGVIRQILGV
jgi:hypothetical protein